MRSVLGVHWKDWCRSWKSNTLATWCEELTHLKSPWCWERLRAGGEGDDRGWDGWMASPTQWTWVWVDSRSWWWTGRPGVLWFMGSQRVRHDWATELNWRKTKQTKKTSTLRRHGLKGSYKHLIGKLRKGVWSSRKCSNPTLAIFSFKESENCFLLLFLNFIIFGCPGYLLLCSGFL